MRDLAVIIRSSGERTADLCYELLLRQAGDAPVDIVNEVPFERALRATYRLGIERARKWTMTLDADVLLRPGAVEALLADAEAMPGHYVQLEGRILDKIMGHYRQAGHRIYRTALLPIALEHVPSDGEAIRPERETLRRMGRLGHPFRRVPTVVGLHDHEQYLADLHRKAMVHARKHDYLMPELIARCVQHQHADIDLRVVLKGVWDGLTLNGSMTIDKRAFADLGHKALAELGLVEKGPVPSTEGAAGEFSDLVRDTLTVNPVPPFQVQDITEVPPQAPVVPRHHRSVPQGFVQGIRQRFRHRGLLRGSVSLFGLLLKRMGHFLDKMMARGRMPPHLKHP